MSFEVEKYQHWLPKPNFTPPISPRPNLRHVEIYPFTVLPLIAL